MIARAKEIDAFNLIVTSWTVGAESSQLYELLISILYRYVVIQFGLYL